MNKIVQVSNKVRRQVCNEVLQAQEKASHQLIVENQVWNQVNRQIDNQTWSLPYQIKNQIQLNK